MITAIVQIKLPEPLTRDKAQAVFADTAPKYREVRGLIRKYYLLSEDGATAGGVYLWKSRQDAEQLYTDDWEAFIMNKYGMIIRYGCIGILHSLGTISFNTYHWCPSPDGIVNITVL